MRRVSVDVENAPARDFTVSSHQERLRPVSKSKTVEGVEYPGRQRGLVHRCIGFLEARSHRAHPQLSVVYGGWLELECYPGLPCPAYRRVASTNSPLALRPCIRGRLTSHSLHCEFDQRLRCVWVTCGSRRKLQRRQCHRCQLGRMFPLRWRRSAAHPRHYKRHTRPPYRLNTAATSGLRTPIAAVADRNILIDAF